jgi:hypothetical protein
MDRTARVLYGVAAILLLVGLVIRAAPTPTGAPREATARDGDSDPGVRRTTRELAGAEAAIVRGNIFSVSRTAPRVRYMPPDLTPPSVPTRSRPQPRVPGLRLVGTVAGSSALIDADPAIRGAELYQVGDVIRGKRISAVSESTVVLEGPGGRTVLRLQPAPQPTP